MIETKNTLYLRDFDGADDSERFAKAMAALREQPSTTLIVEPGIYHITSQLARDTQAKVMGGEYGENPQRIMFNPRFVYTRGIHIDGLKQCRIVAYGATLLVDGFMEPVSITHCDEVELCGFTIDHRRKPYSRAILTEVAANGEGTFDCLLTFDEECPLMPGSPLSLRTRLYDVREERVVRDATLGNYQFVDTHHVRATGTGNLKVGMEFYTVHSFHSRPAILVEHSRQIDLTDITIHSQPGMGIVGNRSEDIVMTRLQVVPSRGHHFSVNTDATHFTSIKGRLKMVDCKFDSHGDDFINVHGYFHAIIEREAPNVCFLQEKTPDGTHAQTLDYPDVGDIMELTDFETLECVDSFRVVAVEPMHEEWKCKVTFDRPLPEDTEGLMLADITRLPSVEIRGCMAAEHFSRSILIKTREALVENNIFRDIEGTAIAVAAESYWFEGVSPANVTIRNNLIIDSCCDENRVAGIYVKADCGHPRGQSIRNITIENNIINAPGCGHAMEICNVAGLRLKNNICTVKKSAVLLRDCTDIHID